ncbi:MAG TPA: tetratricopeptide repeat protein [Bryobacteraceae bacterium]|nr:tetratricopeptide repeat protein [Bryobacteraceae bacterium]
MLLEVGIAVLLAPATAQSHFARGVELREAGRKIEALREFRRAAELDAAMAAAHREIGMLLLDQRDFAGAADAFERAVAINPGDMDSRYNRAMSLANAGRRTTAIRELEALLKEKDDWGQAWFGLGHVYARAGRTNEAERAFRKSITLDPGLFRAHFELGRLLDDKGDREGAMEAFAAGVKLAPDSTSARFRLATLLQQAGRREEAAHHFAAVRELRDRRQRGEQAALAYQQGLKYLQAGDDASAIRELKRAVELRSDFPESRIALGEAYEHSGDLAAAIVEFQRALELAPSAETANHAGVLLAKSGRIDESIRAFRRALEIDPNFANADKNLKQALQIQKRR